MTLQTTTLDLKIQQVHLQELAPETKVPLRKTKRVTVLFPLDTRFARLSLKERVLFSFHSLEKFAAKLERARRKNQQMLYPFYCRKLISLNDGKEF